MAETIGILPEFHPWKGSFTAFVERVHFFLSANGVHEDKYAAVLLSAIDEETYAILRNLMAPALPKEETFDQIVKNLTDHFEPRDWLSWRGSGSTEGSTKTSRWPSLWPN